MFGIKGYILNKVYYLDNLYVCNFIEDRLFLWFYFCDMLDLIGVDLFKRMIGIIFLNGFMFCFKLVVLW